MATPRSLADDLRARSGEALAALVLARPDLIHPVPADLTTLAQRAGSPASVASALRRLDQLVLHVALAAALAGDPVASSQLVRVVAEAMPGDLPARERRARVRAAVDLLHAQALLWGSPRALHLVGAARDLLVPADRGPLVAALDPVVAGYVADPASLPAVLAAAPDAATAALDRLLQGPVVGTVSQARRTPEPGRSGVDWLLAHHLIVPFGPDRAVVPGEVVSLLQARPVHAPPSLRPPAPARAASGRDPDAAAVGAVLDVLHAVAELGEQWGQSPPARLRTGGIAARDLARTARALRVSEWQAGLLVELAHAAGLLAADSTEVLTVLPTRAFDTWRDLAPAARHAALLQAWLGMPRGAPGPEDRPLAPERADPGLPGLRRAVLAVLSATAGAWADEEVLAGLCWQAPRRSDADRAGRVPAILAEMRALGLLVAGEPTSAAAGLLAGDPEPALTGALPEQVDQLIVQGDLTAVVPGLPTAELAALLRTAADPESTGAASVYRFSEASIRRALDGGMAPAQLRSELARHGALPQPLAYLIEDVARRHAALRIGAAPTYLRCDDPVVLAGILADPAVAGLGLVRLADTVLASDQPPEQVMDLLRRRGLWPLPEHGWTGGSTPGRRARGRPLEEARARVGEVSPALAGAAVRAMRAGEERHTQDDAGGHPQGSRVPAPDARGHPVPVSSPPDVIAALRRAIDRGDAIWMGYADPAGVAEDRRVEPVRLVGGYLTALDLATQTIATFSLARITGVQGEAGPEMAPRGQSAIPPSTSSASTMR